MFPNKPKIWFYVIRTYSHTDRRQLIKVESRPIADYADADLWKRMSEKCDKNKEHHYAVIAVPEGQDVLPVPKQLY